MLLVTFFDHIWNLFSAVPIEKLLGFIIMGGVYGYLFYLSRRHKTDIWDGIKGENGKLEPPEMIILISLILYPVIVLSDLFLGLHASEGVFWSLDGIILFALTGRVVMNRFGGPASDNKPKDTAKPEEEKPEQL